jgi:hypothetical protein
MSGQTKLFLLFFACLLTMCTNAPTEPVTYENGLSCVYINDEDANCSYTCTDGTIKEVNLSDVSISSSKEELEAQVCSSAPRSTATSMGSLLTLFPVASPTRTPRPSRTPAISATASSTSLATVSAQDSLLTGGVSMCDLGGKLINFRMTQPPQDITGRSLEVQIGDQESVCYVNSTNRSLLTCRIPIGVSFPADIVVSLDGTVVDEFVYSGLGCTVLTTPTPAPKPTNTNPAITAYP